MTRPQARTDPARLPGHPPADAPGVAAGGPPSGTTAARDSVVDRYYETFNARDFDAWVETLEEDVEVLTDTGVLRGRLVARAYLSGIAQAYPGVTVANRRVVAESPNAVVSEFQLLNPTAELVPDPSRPDRPGVPWRLDGVTCEVLRLRGGLISSLHSYYSPAPTDRTPVAEVPSRAEAARIAHRQAALGRVATQVAVGGSEQDLVAVINQVIAEFAGVDVSLMMRFETADTAEVVAVSDLIDDPAAIGQRLLLHDDIRAVRDSGRALRFGANGWPLRGSLDRSARTKDLQWCVGVPIMLDGKVWGVSLLGSTQNEPFADDIEDGITAFTQLASTALANAQANDELRERAREQAELLEIAELAAAGAQPPEVFAAIARSASALIDGLPTFLMRFVDEDSADLLALHGIDAAVPRAGRRVIVDPGGVAAQVQRTGQPARIDDYGKPPGNGLATQVGLRASVGVSVAVGSRPWGVLVASSMETALPPAAERRLSLIADTGAAAIAGAQARGELLALAEEQAALRRVAELVARGVGQAEVFDTLTAEAAGLIDEPTTLIRFDEAPDYTVVATSGGPMPFGARLSIEEGSLFAEIRRTRRPARIDAAERTGRIDGTDGRDHDGGSSEVGVPIIVGVRLWGVLSATSTDHRLVTTIEHGLRQFVGIVAVAVVNGEARGQLQDLAAEQAALRRVAELAARDARAEEVLSVVARETSVLAGVEFGMVVRYADRHGASQIVALDRAPADFVIGMQAPGTGDGAAQRVWRTGRAALIDDLSQMDGRWPQLAHAHGFTTSAGVPIVIRGELWGALIVLGRQRGFRQDIEEHLAHFAELAGTAIATTEARQTLRDLADEQAALRRVAELAAHNAPAEQVLQAVASEAAALTGVEFTTLLRYGPEGSSQILALDGAPDGVAVGMRSPGTGDGAVQRVWRTARPARIDNLAEMSGVWPQLAARHGFTASAAVPIVIRGALWGALVAVGRGEAFPRPIEQHLANFAELAATAVSAADARQELTLLAEEQAALRRVAELVARGAVLDEIFRAAATEASTLLGNLSGALLRFEADSAVVVAACNSPVPLGLGVPIDDENNLGAVRRTARPSRADTFEGTSLAEIAVAVGVGAGVAVPVVVEGRVWGALTASTPDTPLPEGSEERLTPFAELVAAAIANAENRAKLTASRARVVATADETRRRLQRDVHDGAQQRLVHTIIALKLARDLLSAEDPASALLREGLGHAERANSELRDIVRGILPAALTRGGLRSGLESLLADLALPVDLTVVAPRLPAHIETTAYFLVAEAMTNVAKHSHANRAMVDVHVEHRTLVIDVRDNGVGGADPAGGTGLTGLFDRVEASDGTLTVTSSAGLGTAIHAEIPIPEPLAGTTFGDVGVSS